MVHVGLARTDATVLRDLERAEAEAFKNKVLKPKDPASTAKARQRLEQEGRSIEEEKNKVQMSQDKKTGTGSYKIRFQVTNPNQHRSKLAQK